MISTKNLAELPKVSNLKKLCQSIALLDTIIMPEWEYRYYSYNSEWDINEEMASMRNGSGDNFFILFKKEEAIIKGFSIDSAMGEFCQEKGHPYPGVIEYVPVEFKDFLEEPAFSVMEETSFCIWNRRSDDKWQIGKVDFPKNNDPDGSEELLFIFDYNPLTYQEWAEEYYERPIDIDSIQQIYDYKPLTSNIVKKLNAEVQIDEIIEEIKEISYPVKFIN